MRFWDVATGYSLHTFQGYTNTVNALAFCPEDETLVCGSQDGTLTLWGSAMQYLGQVQAQSEAVHALAYHPIPSLLASGGSQGLLQLWDKLDGTLKLKQCLSGHAGEICVLCFRPDGKLLASGSTDTTIRLWDIPSGRNLDILHTHHRTIHTLAFSPDGQRLVSGDDEGRVHSWQKGQPTTSESNNLAVTWLSCPIAHVRGGVHNLTISPDGRLLAGAGTEHTIFLWQMPDGKNLATLEVPVHSTIYVLAFHPYPTDNKVQLVSGSGEGTICIWDLDLNHGRYELQRVMKEHQGSVKALLFTPDGRFLLSGSADESIKIWEIATGHCVKTLHQITPYMNMDITGATGMSAAQRAILLELGAIEKQ